MEVYKPGSKANLKDISVEIEQAIICRGDYVTYKVSWWASREPKSDIVHESELTFYDAQEKTHIGFK